MIWGAALLALGGAALYLRGRSHARRIEQEYATRRPADADGVVAGAGAIRQLRSRGPAVLLVHGAGDTPQTLGYLATHLHGRGFCVHGPLLPGHGRALRDFGAVRADGWLAAVREEYDALRERHDWVAVVGLSMGGALAVRLAAERPDIPALVLLAPYLAVPPYVQRAALLAPVWGAFAPYVPAGGERSIHDPEERARNLAYGFFTPAALRALTATVRHATAALPHVAAPTLVLHSREDNRIAPADAERAYARLGAREKRLEWLDGTGHVITVDYGRERVQDAVSDWLDAHRAVDAVRSA